MDGDALTDFDPAAWFNSTGFKLIILDECDSMTKDAQFALRRIIEKYTKHTRFCLIGNYVSKIIPALQSRCTRFRFAPLGPESVRERVQHVVDAEALDITPEAGPSIHTAFERLNSCVSSFTTIKKNTCFFSVKKNVFFVLFFFTSFNIFMST